MAMYYRSHTRQDHCESARYGVRLEHVKCESAARVRHRYCNILGNNTNNTYIPKYCTNMPCNVRRAYIPYTVMLGHYTI